MESKDKMEMLINIEWKNNENIKKHNKKESRNCLTGILLKDMKNKWHICAVSGVKIFTLASATFKNIIHKFVAFWDRHSWHRHLILLLNATARNHNVWNGTDNLSVTGMKFNCVAIISIQTRIFFIHSFKKDISKHRDI